MKNLILRSSMMVIALFGGLAVMSAGLMPDKFWTEAAQSGMAEVSLSNLALQRSQNEQVKSFAQTMVTDHTAANTELMSLATSKNVTLPSVVDAKQKAAMDKLSGLSGAAFDKAYMSQMVKDHEAAVKLFQHESMSGTDADVKAFASKTLPTLQGHLDMARSMSGKMQGGNSGNMKGNSNSDMDRNMNMNSNTNSKMNKNSNSNSNRNKNSNGNSNSNSNGNRPN